MSKYQITFGYRAIISAHVEADSEKEAKEKALAEFEKIRGLITRKKTCLEEDSFTMSGCLNMTETWEMVGE